MSPTTGCTQGNKISFRTYCEMMEPFGLSKVCKEIQGPDGDGWESVPVERDFCQGDVGDGFAMYPRHGIIMGTEQIDRWHQFKYWNLVDEDPLKVFEKAVFLSGAFNILEIPSIPVGYDTSKHLGFFREDMPIKLIEGVKTFYEPCLKKGTASDKCRGGNEMKDLVTTWKNTLEHLTPRKNEKREDALVRRFTGRLNQLKENYYLLEGRINDRAKLTAAVAPYIVTNQIDPNSPKELKDAIGRYRQMVKLAIMQYYGEKMPSANTERMGVPTHFMKSNPFGNGSLDGDYDDSVEDLKLKNGSNRATWKNAIED